MRRRSPWLVITAGILALLCVLLAGLAGYWRYANQLPSYQPPTVVMPVPNAYDDYVAAGLLCRTAGAASVQPPPAAVTRQGRSPSPGYSGNGPQAYEPGVSLPQLRAVLARNRPALARLRQGFRKQYRSPPVLSYTQLMPELADFRSLARVLVAEGRLAEREGRPNDAARSYLDCLRLGVDTPRGSSLIYGLVGLAIQNIGLNALQGVADRLDAPTAAWAAREMARLDAHATTYADTLTWEKEGMTAGLLEMFRQPRSGAQLWGLLGTTASGPSPSEVLAALRFSFTPKRQVIDKIRDYIDAAIADARRPYYASAPAPPLPGDPISSMILPGFGSAKVKWAQRDAQWRVTQLRLATHAYTLQYGAPPPRPEALVPAYLSAVPSDPFAPRALVYRPQGSRPQIYSRGPDGDDDGGRDLGNRAEPGTNGDVASLKGMKLR